MIAELHLQISLRRRCYIILRDNTSRTNLREASARPFSQLQLADLLQTEVQDSIASTTSQHHLAAKPDIFLRSHSCEFVLAMQPNQKKCDIMMRGHTRRTWSQITRVRDSARHIKQTNLASYCQVKLRDDSASTCSQILLADVIPTSELKWPTPDIFIHYINIFYFCNKCIV